MRTLILNEKEPMSMMYKCVTWHVQCSCKTDTRLLFTLKIESLYYAKRTIT